MGKRNHQVKTQWYFWFWGTATVAVCAGQLYVGSGYRQMSKSFNRIMDTIIIKIHDQPRIQFLEHGPNRQTGRQADY